MNPNPKPLARCAAQAQPMKGTLARPHLQHNRVTLITLATLEALVKQQGIGASTVKAPPRWSRVSPVLHSL